MGVTMETICILGMIGIPNSLNFVLNKLTKHEELLLFI